MAANRIELPSAGNVTYEMATPSRPNSRESRKLSFPVGEL
jgi:hypothetical protein